MTRMMNKILSEAIAAAQQGQGGYAVQHNHYNQYRGMKKIVDRLVISGLVDKHTAEADHFVLVPTDQARAMMLQDA